MPSRLRSPMLALLVSLAACAPGADAAPPRASALASVEPAATPSADFVADSALAAALARFRDGLPHTDTLGHATASADAVVREVARLLAARDTLGLARLHLSRAEWAWIVYPESRYARAPYRQRPEVGWMLIAERSSSALARLLQRRGGRRLDVAGWQCADSAQREGRTTYWGRCAVTYRDSSGALVTERLFSSIVERDGRFKIGSYSNQF